MTRAIELTDVSTHSLVGLYAEYDTESIQKLARALGFHEASSRDYGPYIVYLLSHWPGRKPKSEYINLVCEVVEMFSSMEKSLKIGFIKLSEVKIPKSGKCHLFSIV